MCDGQKYYTPGPSGSVGQHHSECVNSQRQLLSYMTSHRSSIRDNNIHMEDLQQEVLVWRLLTEAPLPVLPSSRQQQCRVTQSN